MTQSTTVPFSKLVAADAINARASSKEGIDELAHSIRSHGLIQPLAVRPADGSDKFELIDGRRRYMAMAKLVKDKASEWTKSTPVPVLVRNEGDAEALETSLVANTVRLPMHAVDQFEVFARLAEQGKSDSDIASRFGISERTVRQQKALGRLAPVVREAWKKGKIDAEAARAFAASPDQEAQAAAYESAKRKGAWAMTKFHIRQELTGERVKLTDASPAVIERYTAAGGTASEDLFEDARYLDDAALYKRCAIEVDEEKIAATRERLSGQGWAWVASADELPGNWRYGWKCVNGQGDHLTEAESEQHDKMLDELADHDAGSAEALRIEAAIRDLLEAAALKAISPEQRARSGCVIELDRYNDDGIEIFYGVLRPADDGQTDIEDADGGACDDSGCDDDACGDDDGAPIDDHTGEAGDRRESAAPDEATPHISQALSQTLSEARTLAAAAALRTEPLLAMSIITAALMARNNSPSNVVNAGHDLVRERDGRDFAALFAEMADETPAALNARFAHAVATTLDLTDATWKFKSRDTGIDDLVAALPVAPYLAAAAEHFVVADYFTRASKAVALAAIDEMREAGCAEGLAPVDVLADMKKADLAAAAAESARSCAWLPPELRHPGYTLGTAQRPTDTSEAV